MAELYQNPVGGIKHSGDFRALLAFQDYAELVGGGRRLLLREPSANTPYPIARTFAPPPPHPPLSPASGKPSRIYIFAINP